MVEGKMMLWFWIMMTTTCSTSLASSRFPSLLRTVTDKRVGTYEATDLIRISGPNGYCVDVKDGDYHDGNAIILWPCKSDPNNLVNQLWTFPGDGTIRSNGMCLSTYGHAQNDYIMIYTCGNPRDFNIWEVREDGEIINPWSGLVLTALTPTAGTVLTVEENVSSSFQTWRIDNNTEPDVVSIIGYQNLCLQTTGNSVWVTECEEDKAEQRWLIYPDGTVRPEQRPNGCLSYDNLIDAKVLILSCGLGPSSQRWLFTGNDAVLNSRTGLVLDVRKSNPSLQEIIVYPPTGNSNQRWQKTPRVRKPQVSSIPPLPSKPRLASKPPLPSKI